MQNIKETLSAVNLENFNKYKFFTWGTIWILTIWVSLSFIDYQGMITKNFQKKNIKNSSEISSEYSDETKWRYEKIDELFDEINNYDTLKMLASQCKADNQEWIIIDCKKFLNEEKRKIFSEKNFFESELTKN